MRGASRQAGIECLLAARVIAALLLVAACSGLPATTQPVAEPTTPRPTATPRTTPSPVGGEKPWPAEFEKHFCLALHQNDILVDDLVSMAAAAEAGDLENVSLYAYAASGNLATIDMMLELAPAYGPAEKLIKRWRAANKELEPAMSALDEAAADGSLTKIERAAKRLEKGAVLLSEATPLIVEFVAETGFACE
jgi:hypothetical protein